MQAYELSRPARVEAQPFDPSTRQIVSGRYWIGGTGMALVVQGNQYYYSDESGQTDWQPISQLRYVQDGVVLGGGYYWCLSTLPGPQGMCSPNGWENPTTIQERSCVDAFTVAHRQLLEVNNMESLTLTRTAVSDRYPDNPTARPDGYRFLMVGRGGYDVLASVRSMTSISTAIITNCSTVSVVVFSAYPEGEATYGLVNNRVQSFDCYDAYEIGESPNPRPPWGYEVCFP